MNDFWILSRALFISNIVLNIFLNNLSPSVHVCIAITRRSGVILVSMDAPTPHERICTNFTRPHPHPLGTYVINGRPRIKNIFVFSPHVSPCIKEGV